MGCQCGYRFYVLFSHEMYTVTHTSLVAPQCCIVQADTDAAAQLVPQRDDESKHTSRGYNEMGNRTYQKQSKIIPSCCFTASFCVETYQGEQTVRMCFEVIWPCLQGPQNLRVCEHVRRWNVFTLCSVCFVCFRTFVLTVCLNWVEPEQHSWIRCVFSFCLFEFEEQKFMFDRTFYKASISLLSLPLILKNTFWKYLP